MKISTYNVKANGSNLVAYYEFTNGYTAEQWQSSNPFSGSCLLVYTAKGSFASDTVKEKALLAINKYHS